MSEGAAAVRESSRFEAPPAIRSPKADDEVQLQASGLAQHGSQSVRPVERMEENRCHCLTVLGILKGT